MIRKRPLTTAVYGAAPALALGYFVQRQGSSSSIRWMG
jgi:high-affinity Fe2+/Pb2+ permease